MKRLLLALALLVSSAAMHAQTNTVPLLISYHGRVTDANGVAIGNTAPTNRKVRLRIYNHKSDSAPANKLYTEEQTVTISNGEFSVLIGAGTTPISGEANAATFDTTFNPAAGSGALERYLGVSVADAQGVMGAEISPRQQIVTTAFAMRAKVAEGLANPIAATQIADGTITAAKIANNTITATQIATGTITSSQIASGAVSTTQIADGAITAGKLAPGVGTVTNYTTPITITTGDTRTDIADYNEQLILRADTDTNMRLALSADIIGGVGSGQIQAHHATVAWSPLRLNPRGGKVTMGAASTSTMQASGGLDVYGPVTINSQSYAGAGSLNVASNLSVGGSITGSLNGSNLVNGTVGTEKLNFSPLFNTTGSVTSSHIADGNVTNADLGNGSVGNSKLADGSITSSKLASSGFGVAFFPDGVRTSSSLNVNYGGESGVTMTVKAGGGDSGVIRAKNSSDVNIMLLSNIGNLAVSGTYTTGSDRRLKHNINSLGGSLDKLLKLHSVTFEYNDTKRFKPGVHAGFIAQEMEEIFPEWVFTEDDGMKSIGFRGFESYTVQALRELRAEKDAQLKERDVTIAALEQNVAAMKTEAAETKARLAQLEKALAKFTDHAGD